jgi:nucleotide-binding universal stress UspA family protein
MPVWREAEGGTVEELVARESGDADLLVLVRPGDEAGKAALHAGIFASGRLLLLAPPEAPAARGFGRRIAIAWHPSGSAVRPLEAAMPWLRRAEQVLLLTITDGHVPPSPEAALAILAAQGIAPEQIASAQGRQSVGARLLDEAHRWRADCLVMGAYRHPRLLEMILGGVTQHMLNAADLPLFLLHG